MTLAFDIGNTCTKIAVFDKENLLHYEQLDTVGLPVISRLFADFAISQAIISSVKGGPKNRWEEILAEKTALQYFGPAMARGVNNHYLTPSTLGTDRLAAVVGAASLFAGSDNLVISAGTCITYDRIDQNGNYFGGSISPGLYMRYKALNNYTAGLPLLEPDRDFKGGYGGDTASAIRSGVQNGIRYELTGFIESYRKNTEKLNIILTGGDSNFFDTLLKNSIFAPYIKIEPYLVLKGLNAAIYKSND